MPKKQKRNSAYYDARLKREHPTIYTDFKSGKYNSLREACIASGLKKAVSTHRQMLNLWNKSTSVERARFLNAIGTNHPTLSGASKITIVDSHGYLIPKIRTRIQYIMQQRNIKMGVVMKELGFKPLDPSLGFALNSPQTYKIRPDLSAALADWLDANSAIK